MKRRKIADFFGQDKELMDNESVATLIDYTRDLEYELFNNSVDKSMDKTEQMRHLLYEIKVALNSSVGDMSDENVDYHHMLCNLKKYFNSYIYDHKISL